VRLVDVFLAKSNAPPCASFADTADIVAKVAFKMFLGVPALVGSWSSDRRTFSLVFTDNPLAEFTELPEKWGGVWYSNVLCGVIKGALEMVRADLRGAVREGVLPGGGGRCRDEARVRWHRKEDDVSAAVCVCARALAHERRWQRCEGGQPLLTRRCLFAAVLVAFACRRPCTCARAPVPGSPPRTMVSSCPPCGAPQVQMEVDARFVRCTLRGEDLNEIRVTLLQVLQEKPPVDDE